MRSAILERLSFRFSSSSSAAEKNANSPAKKRADRHRNTSRSRMSDHDEGSKPITLLKDHRSSDRTTGIPPDDALLDPAHLPPAGGITVVITQDM